MTGAEWNRVVERLAQNWPHQLQPATALEKYRHDLDGFPVEQVLAAVETWYRDGREWPPTGGQILGRLADLTVDPAAFHVAVKLLRQASRLCAHRAVEDRSRPEGYRLVDERMTFLEAESPFLAAFVYSLGRFPDTYFRDSYDETRLRQKYEACIEEARHALVYGGIDGAGLSALERLRPPDPEPTLEEQAFARVAARRRQIESQAA